MNWELPADFSDRYGPWALIAGGSEGTGEAFARRLAAEGINLVLLARRQVPLDSLAADVRAEHNVEVRTASVDLGDADTPSHRRMGADLSAHSPMDASDVADEALANFHNGPTYVVGEHNRAASEFILTPHNRGAIVSSMSESSAGIAGDEMLPMVSK